MFSPLHDSKTANTELDLARDIQTGDVILIAGNETRVDAIHELPSGALVFDVKLSGRKRACTHRPLQLVERIVP